MHILLPPQTIKEEMGKTKAFVIKPDRGGRGSQIRYYGDADEFQEDSEPLESTTGLYVIQEFIQPNQGVYRWVAVM